tara:strand:- start:90 stop:266 length:177 start_codon:yes stop_codon:yes gene_type:complete
MLEKYNLTVKPSGIKKVKVEQELPSGRRIPYMKSQSLGYAKGGKLKIFTDKPAWMRNR